MTKKLIFLSLIIIISLLSYFVNWFNYVLILIAVLALVYILLIGLISIFKKVRSNHFKTPALLICICITGVIISLFRPYDPAVIESENISTELQYAYNTDQDDRKELKSFVGYFSELNKRDSLRLMQVRKYHLKNKITKPIDKFHAAFIFHHSDNSEDYKIASELASEAANSEKLKDNYTVQWLQKASYDRYMLSIGEPEKYNTQNNFSIDFN